MDAEVRDLLVEATRAAAAAALRAFSASMAASRAFSCAVNLVSTLAASSSLAVSFVRSVAC